MGCLLLPLFSFSKTIISLYTIEKSVKTEQQYEREKLLPAAMLDMLVKVTGDRQCIDDVELQHLSQVQSLQALARFKYLRKAGKLFVALTFSENVIKKIIHQHHLTFWPKERPEILAWVVLMQPKAHRWAFVSEENQPRFLNTLRQQALWRGIPLNLPVLDLQDHELLNSLKPLKHQVISLKKLSQRYQPDYILIISVRVNEAGEYQSDWQLLDDSEQVHKKFIHKNEAVLLSEGMNQISDIIAERHVLLTENVPAAKKWDLLVSNVNSVDDYLKIMNYLQHTAGVDRLDVRSVQGDQIQFSLKLLQGYSKVYFRKKVMTDGVLTLSDEKKDMDCFHLEKNNSKVLA